jgi:AcrR family transcriptional regulator
MPMPTGVAIRDPREQLFDAAARVLLRAGPNALTSRAVTDEAGVAKGVLHRHFTDFDEFLTELVLNHLTRLEVQGIDLYQVAGTGSVADHLTGALRAVFESVAVAIIPLITFRDELRARLRRVRPGPGIPVLREAAALLADYLRTEQECCRIAGDADIDTLVLTLLGAGHLLAADREAGPPDPGAMRRVVDSVVAPVLVSAPDRVAGESRQSPPRAARRR